jgi:cysteine desulfurase
MHNAYFDNNATTKPLPQVVEAMTARLQDGFGNPSSIYRRGREARAAVEQARRSVARLFGCAPTEIVFTSGGTEGDNNAIFGLCQPGDHIITSAIEHDAVLQACRAMERRGCKVSRLVPDASGRLDPDLLRRSLRPETRLISVMMANNETGVLQPVEEIGGIAAKADVWFHVDAVQAAGKVPIDVNRIGCDLLSISAHKIHGPQGIGALFIRRGTPVKPIIVGGHQEHGHRAGTENLPGIVGLGVAADFALAGLSDGTIDRIAAWTGRIEESLLAAVPQISINGRAASRVGNTISLTVDYVPAVALVVALDDKGISVSAGSACQAGSKSPSHVLTAMGLSAASARSTIRISLGKTTIEEDIERLIAALPEAITEARRSSPLFARTTGGAPLAPSPESAV